MSGPKKNDDHYVPQNPRVKTQVEDSEQDTYGSFDRMSTDSKLSWSQDHGKGLDLPDPGSFRSFSTSPFQNGRASPLLGGSELPTIPQTPPTQGKLWRFWVMNKGVVLVALSQLFGALMNLTARLLELEGEGMHPLQVLFARQSVTMVCCCAYMYWMKTPDFPFGKKEVRWLLIARGVSGFFGIFGMWYSMMYLPLAEATVITFLAPSVAGYVCYIALREPFTRAEQIGTVIAFFGVVLIAHPASLFTGDSTSSAAATAPEDYNVTNGTVSTTTLPGLNHQATTAERLTAIGVAILGVFGAAGAFTTIRWIGKRAHPLISVNYFATWCTIVCAVVLTIAPLLEFEQPALRFALPHSGRQWLFMVLLGVFGFIMQFLLTAGLGMDRSNRANAMVYTHMLFAAGFDRFIFGNVMGWMSLAGCGLIIGSALWVVLMKSPPPPRREFMVDVEVANVRDTEAVPMLADIDGGRDEDLELERAR
ncbi:putative transport protein [Colletotrichum gloeosporioides]|uniref:Putative transport protein n=1 Tax=Colletotrichum gloeosporioides TaxID=474922 RepID=A0A8H4FEY2_COLGL|nr:putative transport protein [Colletotrichum gloeosporioides]KAF3799430.1 putative transport protein [Colletotrichum gloeosporioides]